MSTPAAPTPSTPAAPTPSTPAAPTTFDPFLTVPYLRRSVGWNSSALLITLPVVALLLFAATWVEGTLGTLSSLQVRHDVRAALGVPHTPPSQPAFPLMRDLSSIILITVICLTVPLVHLQWKYMRQVIPSLVANGALRPRTTPIFRQTHRLMLHPRVVPTTSGSAGVDKLVAFANRTLSRIGRSSGLVVGVSFVLALLVAVPPTQNGIFQNIASGVPHAELKVWLAHSYHSWWASTDHLAGFILYVLLLALGIFLVIIQNTAGLVSVWTLLGLSAVAEFDLDWLNRDQNFGWASVANTYRTVVLSLIIDGTALSVTLLALGLKNFPWTIAIVLVWMVMLPATTIGPLVALRGISKTAQAKRVDTLVSETTITDVADGERLRTLIQGIHKVRAHPLRVSRLNLYALFVAILLPILLTIAQIYFTLR